MWTDGGREGEGAQNSVGERQEGGRGKKKAGRLERALKEGNIRTFSLVCTGTQRHRDQSGDPNKVAGSLNNMHRLMLSAVKLQLMQAGRCVRRNRAWAECTLGHKPYILCLLYTLNTHYSVSVCVRDECCIIYGHCFCGGKGPLVWQEVEQRLPRRQRMKWMIRRWVNQFLDGVLVFTDSNFHVMRVPLSLLSLCLLIKAKPSTDHIYSALNGE